MAATCWYHKSMFVLACIFFMLLMALFVLQDKCANAKPTIIVLSIGNTIFQEGSLEFCTDNGTKKCKSPNDWANSYGLRLDKYDYENFKDSSRRGVLSLYGKLLDDSPLKKEISEPIPPYKRP